MPLLHHKLRASAGRRQPNLRYVGGYAGTFAGANPFAPLNSLTNGLAGAAAIGDLVIGSIMFESGTSPSTINTGAWDAIIAANQVQNGVWIALNVLSKRLTAADASITFSTPTARNYTFMVEVWRGSHATTPIDATPTSATLINSGQPDAPSITTATPGAIVLAIGAILGGGAGSPLSPPSSMGFFRSVTKAAGTSGELASAGANVLVPGGYNPPAFGGGPTPSGAMWVAASVPIRPA